MFQSHPSVGPGTGKLVGAKPPLRPKHVWSIRTKLQIDGRTRDLAIFNLAIDSKLRGCDVVALKVEDIAPRGYAVERAIVRQKKTCQPVRFELTEQTRQAVDDYLRAAAKNPGEFLFAGRRGANQCLTTKLAAAAQKSTVRALNAARRGSACAAGTSWLDDTAPANGGLTFRTPPRGHDAFSVQRLS